MARETSDGTACNLRSPVPFTQWNPTLHLGRIFHRPGRGCKCNPSSGSICLYIAFFTGEKHIQQPHSTHRTQPLRYPHSSLFQPFVPFSLYSSVSIYHIHLRFPSYERLDCLPWGLFRSKSLRDIRRYYLHVPTEQARSIPHKAVYGEICNTGPEVSDFTIGVVTRGSGPLVFTITHHNSTKALDAPACEAYFEDIIQRCVSGGTALANGINYEVYTKPKDLSTQDLDNKTIKSARLEGQIEMELES
jgi:hypothetical protein